MKKFISVLMLVLAAVSCVKLSPTEQASLDLLKASYENRPEGIADAMSRGADINARDSRDFTSLMYASAKNNFDAVKKLLQYKPDLEAKDEYGNNALILSSAVGHQQVVAELIRAGANINSVNTDRQTPLIHAAIYKQKNALKTLIDLGADVTIRDKFGASAMTKAKAGGDADVISMLENAGARE